MPIITIGRSDINPIHAEESTKDWDHYEAFSAAEQQGVAGFITWLKAIRLDKLLREIEQVDLRKENALAELKVLAKSVEELISSNRGGDRGIHGFIGERAHVHIRNALALIKGADRVCELIDDNGMTDYWEDGVAVQQKACQYKLGLPSLLDHKAKYPDFIGIGQIPKDFYEKYRNLERLTPAEAGKLTKPDYAIWREIQKVKEAGIVVTPMECTYDEIQKSNIHDTINNRKKQIETEAQRQAAEVEEVHRPTFREGLTVAATSAAVEGVMSGAAEVLHKHHEGKRIKDYDVDDLKDVGKATIKGIGKGAFRGSVVYAAANFTHIPAPAAGAAVTVVFDSTAAVKKYANGQISGAECTAEIGKSAFVATAGAIGAKLGGKICPIPVVGEVVGGFLFSFTADKGFGWVRRNLASRQTDLALVCA